MKYFIVPLLLLLSSALMALAWLGHLKFKQYPLAVMILISWAIVLPEYIINVTAIRWGHGTFSGNAMATFNLCSGVLCVALVSAFYLKEPLQPHQVVGFVLLAVAMFLVAYRSAPAEQKSATEVPAMQTQQEASMDLIEEQPAPALAAASEPESDSHDRGYPAPN